ncbi:UNVERIFIED_CONTAM: hypothetical protein PYX00_007602 [Menopon gallinae]
MGESPQIKYFSEILKSPEDKRSYRAFELPNKLQVLLISDPETEKAAAALDVNVGYLSDPQEIPGLAHFCEHMLFLGTEKYPGTNDYSKYISEHGGHNNASTSSDHTVYYFDIMAEYLEGALDRFSQFFICPLFTEDSTEKEVNAVNSEYEKNYPKDLWRFDQLEKHTSKLGHPYNKFSTGNIKTLLIDPKEKGIDVRNELMKFHEKWYSANIMTLAILGKEDLSDLEKMAVSLFSGILNKNADHLEWTDHPFGPEQLKLRGYVVPNKNLRSLNISFPIADFNKYYKAKPYHYISSLIGHEGPGSLLSALKNRGWCYQLFSGARTEAKGFGFFFIKIDLTEEGIDHVNEIVELCFQYINMMNQSGPQKLYFEEFQKIQEAAYRFKEKEQPISYVASLVRGMHLYPMEDILIAPYIIDDWNPSLIIKSMEQLKPKNIRLAVIGQKFDNITDQTEPWYGTKYKLETIPNDTLQAWENSGLCSELALPKPNDFITNNFEIYPREEAQPHPVIIQESLLTRVWYKQDDKFLLPRANIKFELFSPLAYLDPLNCNLTHMYAQLLEDSLNEYAYAAELAGLRWSLKNTEYGLQLSVGGYNDKQAILLDKILQKMTNLDIDPQRFDILKENYIRSLKNFDVEQPYEQASYYLTLLILEHAWQRDELLEAAEELTVKRMEDFVPQLLSKLHVECLIHGNVTKEKSLELVSILENRLKSTQPLRPLLPPHLLRKREIQIVDGSSFLYEISNRYHKSSCTETYFQCCTQSTPNNMLMEILVQIISDPAFDILRNKEQLGYIVYSGLRRSNCVQGLRMIIQSEKHPSYVEQRIEAFLSKFREMLVDMDEKEFETHKEALANIRLEKPKTLAAQTRIFWREISLQQYHFNRAEEEVKYLRTITKKELLEFFDNYIKYEAPHRRKLSVHVLSQVEGGAGTLPPPDLENLSSSSNGLVNPPPYSKPNLIEDITQFKSSHGLYPLVQPYVNLSTMKTKSKL